MSYMVEEDQAQEDQDGVVQDGVVQAGVWQAQVDTVDVLDTGINGSEFEDMEEFVDIVDLFYSDDRLF